MKTIFGRIEIITSRTINWIEIWDINKRYSTYRRCKKKNEFKPICYGPFLNTLT